MQAATAVAGGPGGGRIGVEELAAPPRRGAAREQQQQDPARHERRHRQRQHRDPALPPARVPRRGRRRLRRRRRRAADPLLDVHAAGGSWVLGRRPRHGWRGSGAERTRSRLKQEARGRGEQGAARDGGTSRTGGFRCV